MKEISKYVCDHCNREYRKKVNAERHERSCWKNPNNRTCLTCTLFNGYDYESDGSEFGMTRYIVCKEYPDLPDSMIPVTNCEFWVHDQRTKKEKEQERLNELTKGLGETGLTF